MDRRYADTENVIESLSRVKEMADGGDSGKLVIIDAGQARVVAETDESMGDRNLWSAIHKIDDAICSIEWDIPQFGGMLLELGFHESAVEETLVIDPAGPNAIDPTQATEPTDLGPDLERSLSGLAEEHDAIFTFKGVEAASMANMGYYTDFEYKYSIDGVSL